MSPGPPILLAAICLLLVVTGVHWLQPGQNALERVGYRDSGSVQEPRQWHGQQPHGQPRGHGHAQIPFVGDNEYERVFAARPGVDVLLRPKLFADAAVIAAGIVNAQFSAPRPLPDVNTTQPTPVLGDSMIVLTNVTLQRVFLDGQQSSVTLGDGLIHSVIDNSTVQVEFDFYLEQIRWPHVKSHGHAIVTAAECLVTAEVALRISSEGLVEMSVGEAEVVLGELDIQISETDAAWLYDVLANIFKGNIKDRVADAVRSAIQQNLPAKANEIFKSMPRAVNVSDLVVNTSFSGSIDIFTGYALGHVDASVMGCPFSSNYKEGSAAPSAQNSQPLDNRRTALPGANTKRSISIFVLSTVPNCLAWAWFVNGPPKHWRFDRSDPANVAPPEVTNCSVLWSAAVPQVDEAFKNAACSVDVSLDRVPAIKVGPAGNPGTVEITIKAVLQVAGQTDVTSKAVDHPLFAMLVTVILQFAPSVSADGTLITASLEDAEIIPELLNSTFATPIDMARAQLVFNAALGQNSDALENFVKEKSLRIPPVDHIRLVSPSVDIRPDELVFSFDPAYVD